MDSELVIRQMTGQYRVKNAGLKPLHEQARRAAAAFARIEYHAVRREANSRAVTLHLREDTPLDPKKIMELVRKPKSPYRLTPDMRLSRRFEGSEGGLVNAETVLAELAPCLRPGA